MNFISFSYLLFLPATALLYYLLPQKLKNAALLAASWFFYICWNPVFSLFLLFSTLSTYVCGLLTEKHRRKLWLILTLLLNFGLLLVFKYGNFLIGLGNDLLSLLGISHPTVSALDLIAPIGISFYTFQSAGYIIDVWRGTIKAERNFLDYALFVGFFPQIASGPIGRAGELLPQLKSPRRFSDDNLKSGCLRIIWGMTKKMLVADHLAVIVKTVFSDVHSFSGDQIVFSVLCLSFQIYLDFSAYTDIALGSAQILGLSLTENFRAPYLARSLKDFWRRWHISLSTWFRDYLYFPLGGSRRKKLRVCLNVIIVFAVSGLWHGAAMTFVIWGLLHGIMQAAGILLKPVRERIYKIVPKDRFVMKVLSLAGTFLLVTAAWVFFRADSTADALYVLKSSILWFANPSLPSLALIGIGKKTLVISGLFLIAVCTVDVLKEKHNISDWLCRRDVLRYAVFFVLIISILIFGYYGNAYDPQDFVYFRF